MVNKLIRNLDYSIPLIVLILIAIGLCIIASASYNEFDSLLLNTFFKKQIIAALLGIIIAISSLFFNYRILKDYAKIIYAVNALILIVVLVIGTKVKGGQGWIRLGVFNFQPAEIAKLAVIITLADLLASKKYDVGHILGLIVSTLHLMIPFGLILAQNDLGSALVLIGIFIGMIYVAGANGLLLVLTGLGSIGVVVGWIMAHLYLGVYIPLKEYQLNRLLVLVNPYIDPRGSGYNVIQSMIAIGSGGLFGKGLFAGTQNQLNFLPERHTDFIFSVLGEELGFIGTIVTLLCYLLLLWRGIKIAQNAQDDFGRLVAIGIVSMFAFHILENVGMTIGIMPVTGIPLPFLSYGGSSLITNLIAIGLLININIRSKRILF